MIKKLQCIYIHCSPAEPDILHQWTKLHKENVVCSQTTKLYCNLFMVGIICNHQFQQLFSYTYTYFSSATEGLRWLQIGCDAKHFNYQKYFMKCKTAVFWWEIHTTLFHSKNVTKEVSFLFFYYDNIMQNIYVYSTCSIYNIKRV